MPSACSLPDPTKEKRKQRPSRPAACSSPSRSEQRGKEEKGEDSSGSFPYRATRGGKKKGADDVRARGFVFFVENRRTERKKKLWPSHLRVSSRAGSR